MILDDINFVGQTMFGFWRKTYRGEKHDKLKKKKLANICNTYYYSCGITFLP